MDDLKTRLQGVHTWLQDQYAGIRTGQATPALLDTVKVENYGSLMPINQVGSVGAEDARTLRISTWDASVIPAVERALQEADLGVSVASDSSGVRVIFPELTSERREQLLKLAKQKLEDARISVKSARDDSKKEIDRQQKEGEISEDEKFSQMEVVQKEIDSANKKLEDLFTQKETEISK